ncbi:hypothetical protein SD71_17205 [Cohnella kolymensis]|uniref:Uncharacterized protein n=1 Tax=Cohnella kolymensis TaxID=1590652 RepID=A0ABR5A1I0_9BACL|nr:hypothetical protein [Cohnella kolymensis]KIL34777.1 hypothetical protein SD71_17205 [Cohnella kolymensis]
MKTSKKVIVLSAVSAFVLLTVIIGLLIVLYRSSHSIVEGNPVSIKSADIVSDQIALSRSTVEMTEEQAESAMISYYYAAMPSGTTHGDGNFYPIGKVNEAKFESLLNAIHTERDVRNVVALIHDSFNERTGFGNFRSLENKHAPDWDYLGIAPFMETRLYAKLAQALPVSSFVKDLETAGKLVDIAAREKDVKAVIYLHRIFHDLDYWAFEEGAQGGDFWGVTESAKIDRWDTSEHILRFITHNNRLIG